MEGVRRTFSASVLETATAAQGTVEKDRRQPLVCRSLSSPGPRSKASEESDSAIKIEDVKAAFDGETSDELRNLILDLDRRLANRFDHIESSLHRIGQQITNQHLAGKASPASNDAKKAPGQSGLLETLREEETSITELAAKPTDSVSTSLVLLHEDGAAPRGAVFNLREEWKTSKKPLRAFNTSGEDLFKPLDNDNHDDESCDPEPVGNKPWYVLMPSGYFRLGWDLTTMALVAHDMAVIPVHMGFGTDDNIVTKMLFWPFLLFWTADIPLTFLTGYYSKKGHVETKLLSIAKNYIITWFLLDLSMVSSSWTEAFIGFQASGLELGRVGKTLRILRIVRSMRLLRLVKLRRILEDIQDRITSEYFHIIIAVLRLSVVIVWTNHFIACTWWGIGASGPEQGAPDAGSSWTSHFMFQNVPLPYQYFTALHWSLTQFTPASMEVSPRNLGERMFAVMVLIFAMIVFSSFVSSITAAMTQLRNIGKPVDKSFVILRRYLKSRCKNRDDLILRIQRCVRNALKHKKEEIPESDVELLKYLSPNLQMELMSHLYEPVFDEHPFFRRYAEEDPIAMQRVCLVAVKRLCCARGDVIFTQACTGDLMFFVHQGKLLYIPDKLEGGEPDEAADRVDRFSSSSTNGTRPSLRRSRVSQAKKDYEVNEKEWFAEASLWSIWSHTGTMRASVYSELLVIDPAEFAKVTNNRTLVQQGSRNYGEAFVRMLNCEAEAGLVLDVNPISSAGLEEFVEAAFCYSKRRRSATLPRRESLNSVNGEEVPELPMPMVSAASEFPTPTPLPRQQRQAAPCWQWFLKTACSFDLAAPR